MENEKKWYVLRTISGKEFKVREYIESALVSSKIFQEYVFQVLVPTEKTVSLRNGKRVIKEHPKMPGYLLVECNLTDECFPLLRNIPNVLGFLCNDKTTMKATPVSQAEVNRLVGEAASADEELQLELSYVVGEKVKVVAGPFNGFNGVVQEVYPDKHKVKVVVTIFDRQTPLELDYNEVGKE